MRRKFGAHMSAAGGPNRAVKAAAKVGFACVQLFTKNNNRWDAPPLTDSQLAAFRAALSETGITDPVAHNSYLINLASPDDALWERSITAMIVELERAEALGIADLVCHPGAHVGSGEAAGLSRIARALDEIHRRTAGFAARIDLECTAGQGTCLGADFQHLGAILDRVASPERLGICLDTCHLFAAGHDFGTQAKYNRMIDGLRSAVGPAPVRVWHVNDSLRELGSRVDRHAQIGQGHIGAEALGLVVRDPRFADVPMILETPKGVDADGTDLDAMNLAALTRLAGQGPRPQPGPAQGRAEKARDDVRAQPRPPRRRPG